MFSSLTSQIGVVVMAIVCGLAIFRGDWPERIAGIALAVNWIGSEALEDFNFAHKAQPVIFSIDLAYAGLLGVMLIIIPRQWIVWAFAYQTLIVLTHIASTMNPETSRWDFFLAYYVWSALVLIALAAGTIGVWRERRANSFEPPSLRPT